MAKSSERNKAISYRQGGKSIKEIADKLGVSKSTVSIWCKDIILTANQIEKLHAKMVKGSYAGRLKGAKLQHEKRLKKENEAKEKAEKYVGKLSDRDLLIALTALYWGEGRKNNRAFFISNSDPEMVRFIIRAYKKVLMIEKDRIILALGLNIIHKIREKEIKEYWSKITGIPIEDFRKTIFIKTKNRKKYKNFNSHYGTLRITVKKSIDDYYKIMGLIKGLINGMPA